MINRPCKLILSTQKNFLILYRIPISLLCKCILKTNVNFYSILNKGFFIIFKEKQDSVSQNPITKWGLNLFVFVVYFIFICLYAIKLIFDYLHTQRINIL